MGDRLLIETKAKHSSHKKPITIGQIGEWSKVVEEFQEADDALSQGIPTMHLWELGDMIGAIIRYLDKKFPGVTIESLLAQARHTNSLFDQGIRKD